MYAQKSLKRWYKKSGNEKECKCRVMHIYTKENLAQLEIQVSNFIS